MPCGRKFYGSLLKYVLKTIKDVCAIKCVKDALTDSNIRSLDIKMNISNHQNSAL